jgi:hypothetical protein
MKKSISMVAIAALFAVGAAFTTKSQAGDWWNVNNPVPGKTPGIYFGSTETIKGAFCPGLNNVACAYLISNPSVIIKKP